PNHIADRVLIGLVVRVVFLRTADRLFHRRMREAPFDADDDGLILLVAHDDALERTLRHLEPLIPSTSSSCCAPSAWRQPSVWRISSSSPVQPRQTTEPSPSALAQGRRHVSARQSSSCARCRGGWHAPATCSPAARWRAGSAG